MGTVFWARARGGSLSGNRESLGLGHFKRQAGQKEMGMEWEQGP